MLKHLVNIKGNLYILRWVYDYKIAVGCVYSFVDKARPKRCKIMFLASYAFKIPSKVFLLLTRVWVLRSFL